MPPDPKSPKGSNKDYAYKPKGNIFWIFGGFSRAFQDHVVKHLHNLELGMEILMASNADLNVKVDTLNAKLDVMGPAVVAIRADIQTIKDGLPGEGGMDQAAVDALDVRLGETVAKADQVATDIQALDAENPTT